MLNDPVTGEFEAHVRNEDMMSKKEKKTHGSDEFQTFGLLQHFHSNPSRGADQNFIRQLVVQLGASTNQLEILEAFDSGILRIALQY